MKHLQKCQVHCKHRTNVTTTIIIDDDDEEEEENHSLRSILSVPGAVHIVVLSLTQGYKIR